MSLLKMMGVLVLMAALTCAIPTSSSSIQATVTISALPQEDSKGMFMVKKNASHYEDPYEEDCQSGEVNITIVGVEGAMCSPACGVLDSCPKDVPKGALAKATCALQDMTGRKFCALICSTKLPILEQEVADAQCGPHASCKAISNVGICTYDD
eukprot:CAMPEP_0206247900 /NCGR_PEP_ID=MMETSP0047_2-20121206/20064_1 /ASSEMBLY_ACC=CAM_ASM_000192 /TAXON_ID=195065 /ORGANISM="Chroomonas mesostigmatica_cf, Strain CCMP1168" /LENGTH=153 /DNA_ID=CAMNT_0053673471 /DNA_START=25 /DNA_END=486 /DNA_ORIENTATION=-